MNFRRSVLFPAVSLILLLSKAHAQEQKSENASAAQELKPGPDGAILLHASTAEIDGTMLRYEPDPHKNTLGYWTKKEDTASWDFTVPQAARYRVTMLAGCGNGSGGSLVHVLLDQKVIPCTVVETGGFQNFKPVPLGEFELSPGRHSLKIAPQTKPGPAVMDVRQVVLEPVSSFAKWEKEIADMLARDAKELPATGGIVFAGSSSIRLWDLKKSFPDLAAVNRGFGGSRIADSTHFADRLILPLKPKTIVFYAGDNDSADGYSAGRIAADFQAFTTRIHSELPDCGILFLPVKPSLARWKLRPLQAEANALVRKFCEANPARLRCVDTAGPMLRPADGTPNPALFAKDGLHLSPEGYDLWNGIVRKALEEK